MPVTGPAHTNPFVDGHISTDAHTPSSTSSPKPPTPTVSSSRPLASTGVLGRLSSHTARVSTNPFDTPRVSTNPFDTPRASVHEPASTMRLGTNESDNPARAHTPRDTLANDEPVAASAHERDGLNHPFVEPEPGVRLSPLRIPLRASLDEEWDPPEPAFDANTPPASPSVPGSPHASPSLGPRADTAAAFAKLRNRHGPASTPVTPHTPHTPHTPPTPRIDAGQKHEEPVPELEPAEAPHEHAPAAARPAKRPQNMPNAAAEFAEETMESTGQFMTPMIEAQMFAAESQMFISMVQAQVDVAKAAASAVSDAARKS